MAEPIFWASSPTRGDLWGLLPRIAGPNARPLSAFTASYAWRLGFGVLLIGVVFLIRAVIKRVDEIHQTFDDEILSVERECIRISFLKRFTDLYRP